MRVIITTLAVILSCSWAFTQEREFKLNIPLRDPISENKKPVPTSRFAEEKFTSEDFARNTPDFKPVLAENIEFVDTVEIKPLPPGKETTAGRSARLESDRKFHWKPAMLQSAMFLGIQHGFRMTEQKTRDELDGPFFSDWKDSVKNLKGWDDGGKVFTNYIAHPLQGALTGRIFINNSGVARRQEFGRSKEYWVSRLKAMAWSAIWSTQFEIGPVSEASLGNVGQKLDSNGRSKLTYGDLVLTPTVGTGFVILEDAIDKYILRNRIEHRVHNRLLMKILRSVLTPTTSFANLLRGHAPWWRDLRDN